MENSIYEKLIEKVIDINSPYFNKILDILENPNKDNKEYTESHHILPRSIFPEYIKDKNNIVRLSAIEHLTVHYYYMLSAKDDDAYTKLLNGVIRMTCANSVQLRTLSQDELNIVYTFKADACYRLSEHHKEYMKGKNNPNYNHRWNDEQRRRASEYHKGKMMGDENPSRRPEVRTKISKALKGKPHLSARGVKKSKEFAERCRINATGVVFTQERKDNISKALRSLHRHHTEEWKQNHSTQLLNKGKCCVLIGKTTLEEFSCYSAFERKYHLKPCNTQRIKGFSLNNEIHFLVSKDIYNFITTRYIGVDIFDKYFQYLQDIKIKPTSITKSYYYDGKFQTLYQWAEYFNVNPGKLKIRLDKGESLEEAVANMKSYTPFHVSYQNKIYNSVRSLAEEVNIPYNSLYAAFKRGVNIDEYISNYIAKRTIRSI